MPFQLTVSLMELIVKRFLHTQFTFHSTLKDSNFYSVLHYNSEIWHLEPLKSNLKSKLLSSSAKAIKMCVKYCTNDISFIKIHEMFNRATPDNYLLYKHAILLHKLYNTDHMTSEWVFFLNFNQILTSRQINFMALRYNRKKVGLNALAN